jgi:hypothetical protein
MINDQMFIKNLFELLNEVKDKLPLQDIKNITEFIENREWGLAHEILCIQLYEYHIQISPEFYKKISSFGKSIRTQSSIWLPLKELITEI